MTKPKHNHTANLFIVCVASVMAVTYSTVGNYAATLWALAYAAAVIFLAQQQDLTHEAIKVASACSEGWANSNANTRRLLEAAK